jgi:hypothetical protein
VSEKRLSLTPNGNVRYQLKTPYRESLPRERSECFGHGTTHVIFEPLDFIARLAALVPKPRVNLTRFHGVFAPNSKHRARVTPAKRGTGNKRHLDRDREEKTPAERRAAMTWAQRLKRVFGIDIETCHAVWRRGQDHAQSTRCARGQALACIEDPQVIRKILDHLRDQAGTNETILLPESRAPPVGLFG